MSKEALVRQIKESNPVLTRNEAEKVVSMFIQGVSDVLSTNGEVRLVGFGTFSVRQTKARVGRNPKTGEEITILAKQAVRFKPGTKLKEAMNV